MKELHVYIDGVIGESEGLFAELGFSKKDLDIALANATEETTDVIAHINSPGGYVTSGFAIHDLLKTCGYRVTTIIEGLCGSIATVIALAGDVRKIHANSEFFVHPPFASYIEKLDADEAQKLADELKETQERLLNFYVEATGRDRSELEPLVMDSTTLTAKRAVELNFCTEIVQAKAALNTKHKIFNYISQNQTKMANEKITAEKIGALETLYNRLFKKVFRNETGTLSDGTTLYWDGAIEVGKAVYIDEAMETVAPEGTHLVTTAAGTVEILLDAAGVVVTLTEIEALKSEVENLRKEIADLKADNEAATAAQAELETNIEAFATEIANLKKMALHTQPTPAPQAQATAKKTVTQNSKFDVAEWGKKYLKSK
jgi:ATP-dependent protease ClpP protease subunit